MKKAVLLIWNIIVIVARTILSFVYKLFGLELTDEKLDSWLQFIKFGMVGFMNTILCYIITEGGFFILKDHMESDTFALQISQTTGFVITVFISFLFNNAFVFVKEEGKTRNPFFTLIKTYIAYSFTGVFLNNLLVFLEMNIFHISPIIAPIINIVVDVPINFFLNKLWAYKTE